MKKSAFYSDILFSFSLVGIFTLCFFRYLRIALFPALLLAFACGVLAATANGAWLQSKRQTLLLRKSDEEEKQKLLLHLALLSDEQKTVFFQKVLSARGEVKRFSRLRLTTKEEFFFLCFRFKPLSADEVSAVYRLKTNKTRVILCGEADDSARRLCDRLHIQLCEGGRVYEEVKNAQTLPSDYLGDSPKTKRRLRLCFAKSNSRRFLTAGALVLLTSLITPFPRYYLIFGSALLALAVIVRIFGKSPQTPQAGTR